MRKIINFGKCVFKTQYYKIIRLLYRKRVYGSISKESMDNQMIMQSMANEMIIAARKSPDK